MAPLIWRISKTHSENGSHTVMLFVKPNLRYISSAPLAAQRHSPASLPPLASDGAVFLRRGNFFLLRGCTIEFAAGGVALLNMRFRPMAEVLKRLNQAPAHRREAVIYTGRN